MRIAFIDHLPVGSGLIRFATQLAQSIVEVDNNIEITYFTNWSNYNSNKGLFSVPSKNIDVKILKSTVPGNRINFYYRKILKKTRWEPADKLKKELESIAGFDAVYFTSAHMSDFYEMHGPTFATFHDFNWKYSFGYPNFSRNSIKIFNKAMPQWFQKAIPVCSTNFIRQEIEKFYPRHKFPVEVVYISNLAKEITGNIAGKFDFPYILYPANICSHKNHLNLYNALFILKQQHKLGKVKLILTGAGTDHFEYSKLCAGGIEEAGKDDFDVLGMGYVDNDMMDNLIKHASLNISVSIYEAGSGPAIDAWINKVPFIMSDIASHKEQLHFFNIDCLLFEPLNPYDIAEKIDYALQNPDIIKGMSEKGYEALKKYNWHIAAKHYLNIFTRYTNGN